MKRVVAVLAMLCAMCGMCSGCGFWMNGEYLSVTPNEAQQGQYSDQVIELDSYTQLRSMLNSLVESHANSGIVSAESFNEAALHYYATSAIDSVTQNSPIGAYAVEKITYEIGTHLGKPVIAFAISYRRTHAELLRIQNVENMTEMENTIQQALRQIDAVVVVQTQNYEYMDLAQLVYTYSVDHPEWVMEIPQVNVATYPNKGEERIIELTFTYKTVRDDLRRMQAQVLDVFTSAELYVKDTTKVMDIYSRLYSFLMERDEYVLEPSITPAYSLLLHGSGDNRAFASVYAAMCRQSDLECQVIEGTRNGEPWCWNYLRYRGKYYHLDVLECNETGVFRLRSEEELTGYVWDVSQHPNS